MPYEYSGNLGEDYFNRGVVAEKIHKLVEGSKDPLTVCIDGEWGEGKSFFADILKDCFKKNNYNVIYFDAYKSDYQEDPLTALLAEVAGLCEEEEKPDFLEKLSKFAVPLLGSGLKVALKAATAGALSNEDVGNIAKAAYQGAEAEASSLISSYVKESMELYSKKEESLNGLRAMIEAQAVSNGKEGLLFIVDELDRCRPNYAVEIIEKIKHVFCAKNTDFVLVMNKSQMKQAISHTYGKIENIDNYLEKFLTHSISLPKNKLGGSSGAFEHKASYIYSLNTARVRLKGLAGDVEGSSAFLAFMCGKLDFNLRKIDRVVANLSLNLLLHRDEYSKKDIGMGGTIDWPDYFFVMSAIAVEVGADIKPDASEKRGERKVYNITKKIFSAYNSSHAGGINLKKNEVKDCNIQPPMMLFRAMNEDFGSEAKGMLDSGICDSGMEEVLYSRFFEIYQKSKAISN